jgi:hypothetical protein
MSDDEQTAEYVADLLLMREHYMSLAGALRSIDPMDRETLRLAAIIGSIDRLVHDLLM